MLLTPPPTNLIPTPVCIMWGTVVQERNVLRLATHLKRNIEARSRNHFCIGKSYKYCRLWVGVCILSYPACKALAPYYIVICDLTGSTIFFHIISNSAIFGDKLLSVQYVLIFSKNFVLNIFYEELIKILLYVYIDRHVGYSWFFKILKIF